MIWFLAGIVASFAALKLKNWLETGNLKTTQKCVEALCYFGILGGNLFLLVLLYYIAESFLKTLK